MLATTISFPYPQYLLHAHCVPGTQDMGQQCTKQAKMPNFLEPTFYTGACKVEQPHGRKLDCKSADMEWQLVTRFGLVFEHTVFYSWHRRVFHTFPMILC